MNKPVRISKGVIAAKIPSSYLLQCMATAESSLTSGYFAFQKYACPGQQTICVYTVLDEIFVFTDEEAHSGPFGEFSTIGIGDARKLWRYLSND